MPLYNWPSKIFTKATPQLYNTRPKTNLPEIQPRWDFFKHPNSQVDMNIHTMSQFMRNELVLVNQYITNCLHKINFLQFTRRNKACYIVLHLKKTFETYLIRDSKILNCVSPDVAFRHSPKPVSILDIIIFTTRVRWKINSDKEIMEQDTESGKR